MNSEALGTPTRVMGSAKLVLEDVQQALAANPASRGLIWRLWLTPLLVMMFLGISLLVGGKFDLGRLFPFILLSFFAMVIWLGARQQTARRVLDGKTDADLQLEFTFDERGYTITNPSSSTQAEWRTVHMLHETPSAFLLYSNPWVHQIIPKRAFGDADLARLLELFRIHVPPRRPQRRWLTLVLWWVALIVLFVVVYKLTTPR